CQAEDGIRDFHVTGVQTCALPISRSESSKAAVAWAEARLGPDADCKLLLHDAARMLVSGRIIAEVVAALDRHDAVGVAMASSDRSEEHTSELQSREKLVCRLLLEK